jgi:hypothetical protein
VSDPQIAPIAHGRVVKETRSVAFPRPVSKGREERARRTPVTERIF